MTKAGIVQLLEQYRNKALKQLNDEAKASAMLLISPEFLDLIRKAEAVCEKSDDLLKQIAANFKHCVIDSTLQLSNSEFHYNSVNRNICANVVAALTYRLCQLDSYHDRKTAIRNKFDQAIRTVKYTKSVKKLTEIMESLGIEVDHIESESPISNGYDAAFIKDQINQVKLLK